MFVFLQSIWLYCTSKSRWRKESSVFPCSCVSQSSAACCWESQLGCCCLFIKLSDLALVSPIMTVSNVPLVACYLLSDACIPQFLPKALTPTVITETVVSLASTWRFLNLEHLQHSEMQGENTDWIFNRKFSLGADLLSCFVIYHQHSISSDPTMRHL